MHKETPPLIDLIGINIGKNKKARGNKHISKIGLGGGGGSAFS